MLVVGYSVIFANYWEFHALLVGIIGSCRNLWDLLIVVRISGNKWDCWELWKLQGIMVIIGVAGIM